MPPDRATTSPLRLGVVLPSSGPAAFQDAVVLHAAERAAAEANAGGGVGGRPVEVVSIPADSIGPGQAVPADVLVGGFGAAPPRDALWILPADPSAAGPDVFSAEESPEQAGATLAKDLSSRGFTAPVGVVVGGGPDAYLSRGIATQLATVIERAGPNDSCDQEVASLRLKGVDALAVAGNPTLVVACADAAYGQGWSPSGGIIVPPRPRMVSATRHHMEPGPSSDCPGPRRTGREQPGTEPQPVTPPPTLPWSPSLPPKWRSRWPAPKHRLPEAPSLPDGGPATCTTTRTPPT
ncbi:MAG: ABC transporter substrate-binding protein [Acidimicrobiales bacterium]